MDDTDAGTGPEREPEPERTVCTRCGATVSGGPPLTWTFSMENGKPHHICDTCSRADIRAIEGRLDSTWW